MPTNTSVNIRSYRFSCCSINSQLSYPVFSCSLFFTNVIIPLNTTWCQKWDMAYSALQAPAPSLFNSPDKWPKWKRYFEQYRVALDLGNEDDEHQVSTLLYCLGEETDDMLTSTNINVESRKKFANCKCVAEVWWFFQSQKKCNFWMSPIQSTFSKGDRNYRAVHHFSVQSCKRLWIWWTQGTIDPRLNRCGHPRFLTLRQAPDGLRFDSYESQMSSSSARSRMVAADNLE